jgi:hypothetical protein
MKRLLLSRLAIRWYGALALVMATFNPTGSSFVHWAADPGSMPLKYLAGVVLLIGYVIYIRATLESIGRFGIGLLLAAFGLVLWFLADNGMFDVGSSEQVTWAALVVLSMIMAAGMTATFGKRSISGQVDVT